MATLELPPVDFDKLVLRTVDVDPSDLVRLAWPPRKTHCSFRTDAQYRFDSPDGSFGVLYAAFDLKTAFAESVLHSAP